MKKIFAMLLLGVGLVFAQSQYVEPGLNIIPLATTDSVMHGGETLQTKTLTFNSVGGGFGGTIYITVQLDSCANCSTETDVGFYAGNIDGDWDIITKQFTLDAKADHDTTGAIAITETNVFRIWYYDANSSDDSLRVRGPIYLYINRR